MEFTSLFGREWVPLSAFQKGGRAKCHQRQPTWVERKLAQCATLWVRLYVCALALTANKRPLMLPLYSSQCGNEFGCFFLSLFPLRFF